MRPSGKRRALWLENRRDPDNWFEIPEFGVKPGDVDGVGFRFPIMHIMCDTRPGARPESVRTIVRAARSLARQHFSSLKVLFACNLEFLDLVEADRYEETTVKHRVAFVYQTTLWELRRSWDDPDGNVAANAIASATSTLVAWTVSQSIHLTRERTEIARENAKKPRADVTAQDVADYAALVNFPAVGKYDGFLADAVHYFALQDIQVSESTVARRVRAARTMNLMS